MTHVRQFGVQNATARANSGGIRHSRGPHCGDDTHADNVIRLADHSPPDRLNLGSYDVAAPFLPDEADKDFAALCFALAALTCPFALAGFAITVWLLLF